MQVQPGNSTTTEDAASDRRFGADPAIGRPATAPVQSTLGLTRELIDTFIAAATLIAAVLVVSRVLRGKRS